MPIAAQRRSEEIESPREMMARHVLPEIERRVKGDYPDRLREWQAAVEIAALTKKKWRSEVRTADKMGAPPPDPPADPGPEPQMPRLIQQDVTIEKVATLLAAAAPKGMVIVRDEIAGWIGGMTAYNDAGRQFWLEAYGGRPYRVERQKHPAPIEVQRLAVAVYGGTQPDRLARLMAEPDDGLLARFLWSWPSPLRFDLAKRTPDIEFAIRALDRLRMLDLLAAQDDGTPARPIPVPLSGDALHKMRALGRDAQRQQEGAGGLMRSAWGKARGYALRLSLVIEFLWWCGCDTADAPPREIRAEAFAAATTLVQDYFMPMAERVYGDANATLAERNAATLARWILRSQAVEVYVRDLQRSIRLPGLDTAEKIHNAAQVLVEADWLSEPEATGKAHRRREAYPVNPRVFDLSGHDTIDTTDTSSIRE